MTAADLAIIVQGITPIVREYTASQVEPLLKTIAGLEQRLAAAESRPLTPGPAGKDADAVDLDALAKEAAKLIPTPVNGKDAVVDFDALALKAAGLVTVPAPQIDMAALAKQAAALIEKPTNGKDADPVDLDALAVKAAELVPKAVSLDLDALAKKAAALIHVKVDTAMLTELVEKSVAALPKAKDGQSVTVDDVAPLVAAEVQKAVALIPVPKDGVGIAGTLQDHRGHLMVTLTDGQTKDAGPIKGRDGQDVDMPAVTKQLSDAINALPIPKDGKDGIGFDDVDFARDEDGRIVLKYAKGDVVKMSPPLDVKHEGVWRTGKLYRKGSGVIRDGGWWIAVDDTTDAPGDGKTAWQLAAKRGDKGAPGPPGTPGAPGMDGKDFKLPTGSGGRF